MSYIDGKCSLKVGAQPAQRYLFLSAFWVEAEKLKTVIQKKCKSWDSARNNRTAGSGDKNGTEMNTSVPEHSYKSAILRARYPQIPRLLEPKLSGMLGRSEGIHKILF